MLDRSQLVRELESVSQQLFIDDKPVYDLAKKIWKKICSDSTFQYKVRAVEAPWPVPSWDEQLDKTYTIDSIDTYNLISVDGSQIYPDRHQGVSCYLINIGGVILRYGHAQPVTLFSMPYVFSGEAQEGVELSVELINGKREELEFLIGMQKAIELKKEQPKNLLVLFDGSLIFWHLEAKDPVLKELFLSQYTASLFGLYKERILTASYISSPRSRELVNLLRLQLSDFDPQKTALYKPIERLVDAAVCSFFLKQGERTIVFKNHAHISDQYPDVVQPHFFYIHIGTEIGRVEIPAWIAQDALRVDHIAQMVYDQSQKGRGYPVAIAEAHEQAVVKGPDREFFYHLITKMGIERSRVIYLSQKVIKKRGPSV